MTVREYPMEIDGLVYHPIPVDWIDQGRDWWEDRDDNRLLAVSGAVFCGGRAMKIRFTHPLTGKVLVGRSHAVEADADEPSIEGRRPKSLSWGTWPRSTIPDRDPDDVRRIPEDKHLRKLWGERHDDVPSEGDVERMIMADGGPTVDFGGADVGE